MMQDQEALQDDTSDFPRGVARLMTDAERGQFVHVTFDDGNSLRGTIHRKIVRDQMPTLFVRWDMSGGTRMPNQQTTEMNAESFVFSFANMNARAAAAAAGGGARATAQDDAAAGLNVVTKIQISDGPDPLQGGVVLYAAHHPRGTGLGISDGDVGEFANAAAALFETQNDDPTQHHQEQQRNDRADAEPAPRDDVKSILGVETRCSKQHRAASRIAHAKAHVLARLRSPAASAASFSPLIVPAKVADIFILPHHQDHQSSSSLSPSASSLTTPATVIAAERRRSDAGGDVAVEEQDARFFRRYKKGPKIGEGAFGEVFASIDTHNAGRPVAVKVLRKTDHSEGGGLHNTIVREIVVANAAAHPLLIPLLDVVFCADGNVVFIMPLVEHDLTALMKRGNIFATHVVGQTIPRYDLVRAVFGQLLEVLDDMHRVRCIEHRDIKSSNLLIRSDGAVQLGDFGWSRFVPKAGHGHTGPPCSINYRPLDLLLKGDAGYDGFRIDMWGAGCILYELLTGHLLFPGRSEAEVAVSIVDTLGSPPKRVVASYPAKVVEGRVSSLGRRLAGNGVTDIPAFNLLSALLDYDFARARPTPARLLGHEFMRGYERVLPYLRAVALAEGTTAADSAATATQLPPRPRSLTLIEEAIKKLSFSYRWEIKLMQQKQQEQEQRRA